MPSIKDSEFADLDRARQQRDAMVDLLGLHGFSGYTETPLQRLNSLILTWREDRRLIAVVRGQRDEAVRALSAEQERHRVAERPNLTHIVTPLGGAATMAADNERLEEIVRRVLISRLVNILAARPIL